MALAFSVLGSGSRGNCTALRHGAAGAEVLLIDCGLSPRATKLRLMEIGLRLDDVTAILLTHLDADHFHRGWLKPITRRRIDVHVHERHRMRALRSGIPGGRLSLFRHGFAAESLTVEPVTLAHDQLGTVGFVLESAHGARLGFATDLGRVPRHLLDVFVDLHAIAIESNYDPEMQVASDRPEFLKRRITGGAGHLSNEQSLRAVEHISSRSSLCHVVPLHLSEQCNHPTLVERLYRDRLPRLAQRLTIAHQSRPTPLLDVEPVPTTSGRQMMMFGT